MSRPITAQQDLLSLLVDGHAIHARNGDSAEKVAIERLEMLLGQPGGVRLRQARVHALSIIRRKHPIYLLPPRPPMFIDRSAELETLRQSVIARHVVDLHGLDGAGKTTLAAALVHGLDINHFPDGAVYVNGPMQFEDLLQALFDSFYESDTRVKITLDQTHTYLGNLRALIVLDDVGLGPKQIDPVLDALDEAAVLILGSERTALGRGRAVRLTGLPRQDAVELFKRASDRMPAPDDSPIIDQVCILLNDMPLPIVGVAAQVSHSGQTLTQLLTDLQGRRPWAGPGGDLSVGPSLEEIVLVLDATDRRLISLVAASAEPGASSEALQEMMKLPAAEFQTRVERLRALKLLHAASSGEAASASGSRGIVPERLMLTSAYYQTIRSWLVDDTVHRHLVNYYATRLARGHQLPGDELPGLLSAIRQCSHHGWLDHLKPLVRAADRSLAELRWWAEWQRVLDLTRRAAQAGGDRALEAWALHQSGSILGALGDFERALRPLQTALSMRQALGDESGAALSGQNLEILERLMPVPVEDEPADEPDVAIPPPGALEQEPQGVEQTEQPQESPLPVRRRRRWRLRLALLTACVALVIGTVALRYAAGLGQNQGAAPGMSVSWDFGDAWNALDEQTWTQQINIVAEGAEGALDYFVNGQPAGELFEITLPLCDGAQGTIRVESEDGRSAEVQFAFDSPFCR
jgi:hypothetical protein